jgi:hypothetical protein
LRGGSIEISFVEVMESDCRLNQTLVKQSERPPGRPPHVFKNFVSFEVASSVKKIYSDFKGVVHYVSCNLLKNSVRQQKTRRAKPAMIRMGLVPRKPFFGLPAGPKFSACKGAPPGYSSFMGWSKVRSPGFWNTHSSQDNF